MINCSSLTVNQGHPLHMSYCGNHFGAKCNFSCRIGYRLNGSSTVSCAAPGNKPPGYWDNPLPRCEGTRKRYIHSKHSIDIFENVAVDVGSDLSCDVIQNPLD